MLDFSAVRNKELTIAELVADLTVTDLRDLTNEMVDLQLGLIADCIDVDVVFEPSDPDAHDSYAADEADTDLAWNLGHLVVHVTASSEESAFLAAEMARGVEPHGRSRSEVPWQTMTTIAQCRQRLQESRRMRLATLDVWPDAPYLAVEQELGNGTRINAIARFVRGLSHDDAHIAQLKDVIRQARVVSA